MMIASKHALLFTALAACAHATPSSLGFQHNSDGPEHIFGEVLATQETAGFIAHFAAKEAERMWESTSWLTATAGPDYTVEYKNISGPFAASGIYVTRGNGVVRDATMTADELFALLATPEGYQIIDPASDPADYGVALEEFTYVDNSVLRAERATADIGTGPVEFVVLNLLDYNERLFSSKSIMHDSIPGSSVWGTGTTPEIPRATNTFALRLTQDGSDILVELINWIDIGLPGDVTNSIFQFTWMQALFDRLIAVATTSS